MRLQVLSIMVLNAGIASFLAASLFQNICIETLYLWNLHPSLGSDISQQA